MVSQKSSQVRSNPQASNDWCKTKHIIQIVHPVLHSKNEKLLQCVRFFNFWTFQTLDIVNLTVMHWYNPIIKGNLKSGFFKSLQMRVCWVTCLAQSLFQHSKSLVIISICQNKKIYKLPTLLSLNNFFLSNWINMCVLCKNLFAQ